MSFLLPFLVLLLIVALFTRVDLFFYLLYVLFGIAVVGRLWAHRALGAVRVRRIHDDRIFQGETVHVRLEVVNRGWLPVLWMLLHDAVPVTLGAPGLFREVVSLRPRERLDLAYTLHGDRRGYYPIGPLVAYGGDLLGSVTYEIDPSRGHGQSFIIVYPRIVPLSDLGFPSQSPFGTLPSRQQIFEDPTRIRGVRGYQRGDSLRRIDWKTSSRVGALQVKRYEPAIALETAIFLNLDGGDYPVSRRSTAPELAIVIAASIAVHLIERRQAVALISNGRDPLQGPALAAGAPATRRSAVHKGREHLMHLLDLLARIEVAAQAEAPPFLEVVGRESLGLPWGSTAVLITTRRGEGLFDTLLALRRRGLGVILVMTCPGPDLALTTRRAEQIGVQAYCVESERDMGMWR
jgi:uncharacterized protein (DUF58 family)